MNTWGVILMKKVKGTKKKILIAGVILLVIALMVIAGYCARKDVVNRAYSAGVHDASVYISTKMISDLNQYGRTAFIYEDKQIILKIDEEAYKVISNKTENAKEE